MKNPLQELVGLRVTKAEVVQDYVQLIFGEAAGLTIANDYLISGKKDIAALGNLVLLDASQSESQVVLTFEHEIIVNVSLLPEAYHGPEAMVLNRTGQPIVVWN
jgi:hypothetical protein